MHDLVTAYEIETTRVHPNADSLFIYEVGTPFHEPMTVVGNDETIYYVGDVVAVVSVGAVLDGVEIIRTKLRGVWSYGMIIEATDARIGTDLTLNYDVVEAKNDGLIDWTSIELLPSVREYADALLVQPKVTYRAKVKLHGTNAAVQILPNGEVIAQSRVRVLDVENDNLGFATWVRNNHDYFAQYADSKRVVVIYGEWCGSGVQSGVAISAIGKKIFAVYAIQYGDHNMENARLRVTPEGIAEQLLYHPDVFVLPWYGEPVTMSFWDTESLRAGVEKINTLVADVEACDPWVKEVFGVDGTGEGVVMYPDSLMRVDGTTSRDGFCSLMFKAKGEKHQVRKQKTPVELSPETLTTIEAFVDTFVTPARLEQGVTEACDGAYTMANIGKLLKWVCVDVHKESEIDLADSGLDWKDVQRHITLAAKEWYIAQINKI